MKRYFHFPDAQSALMLIFKPGYPEETATPEQVARAYKKPGRVAEVGKEDFARITADMAEKWLKGDT